MKLKLYIAIFALALLACKKKSEDNPAPVDSNTSPVTFDSTCFKSMFKKPLVVFGGEDTIKAVDGILYIHCQSKTEALSNLTFLGTYTNVIKGDFLLTMEISQLKLSTTNSPKPGSFMFALSNVTGSTLKQINATISPSVFSWRTAYYDTLASKEVTFPLPTAFKYKISRTGSVLNARLYYNTDSLVTQKIDFGSQDLTIDFSLDSDTSGKEFSGVRVTDLQLKQGIGATVKESFGCNINYFPR